MTLTLAKGKLPYTVDDRDLQLATLGLDLGTVEVPEGNFGNYPKLFGVDTPALGMFYDFGFPLGMYGNNTIGDCVLAWMAHAETLDSLEGGRTEVAFNDDAVISDYSAITGYVRGMASTDRGTEVRAALRYHRKTGISDAAGRRRRIGAFAAQGIDVDAAKALLSSLGKVTIGFLVPASAMQEFNHKTPFADTHERAEDGHCVGIVGWYEGNFVVETWGTLGLMTPDFYQRYADEAWGYFSSEMLQDGETVSGLDKEKALAVIAGLN